VSIGAEHGRHGSGALGFASKALPTVASGRSIVGGAVRCSALGGTDLFRLGTVNLLFFTIQTMNDGSIQTSVFGSAIVKSSAADVVRTGVWYYVEMQTDVSVVSAGGGLNAVQVDACQIWVDGALILDETGLGVTPGLTEGVSTYGWNLVGIGGDTNAAAFDDVYVCDGSGASHTAPLGDIQIDVIRPNGAGASTQWTPAGAATNWEATNDLTPDADATTVLAATVGLSDLYQLQDIVTSDGVIGAQLLISARRTAEGSAALTSQLRHAGVTTDVAAEMLSTSFFYQNRVCFVTMPNGDPLTDAHINALQAGFKRTL
jgi:hypothetical protein